MKFELNNNLIYLDNNTTTGAKALATYFNKFDEVDMYNKDIKELIANQIEATKQLKLMNATKNDVKERIIDDYERMKKRTHELNINDLEALCKKYNLKYILLDKAQEAKEEFLDKISKISKGNAMILYMFKDEDYKTRLA